MGKVKSPCCYLWLGNMPTSAWGADTLERWLENRLLPMAPIRYASCSLTTLGMLKESSGKKEKTGKERKQPPQIHLHIYSCQEITGSQGCTQHLLTKTPSLQIWTLPLDFTVTVQKDICIKASTHGAGIYVCFQLIWPSGKFVWGIQLPLGLNSRD